MLLSWIILLLPIVNIWDTEFEYEKAYAVWEYADTAYIDVVYAIENYYTITEQYEEVIIYT